MEMVHTEKYCWRIAGRYSLNQEPVAYFPLGLTLEPPDELMDSIVEWLVFYGLLSIYQQYFLVYK